MKRIAALLILTGSFALLGYAQDHKVTLSVMSYNIRHGEGNDNIVDLSRAARIIQSQAPDLCAIQEVDDFCPRSDSISQTDFLARNTHMAGSFGKFMDFQGGRYGMASLSGKPVISQLILPLPDGKHEPRSSIVLEVRLSENHPILFVNVHLEWIGGEEGNTNRMNQAKALLAYINSVNKATIITGDFNCTPDSPPMKLFAENGFVFVQKGEDNFSFQLGNKTEIDHLIYRNTEKVRFAEKQVRLLNEPVASDHRPLVVKLEASLLN